MRLAALALALLTLSGCFVGSIYNLATGPQVYGGVRQDVWWFNHVCKGQVAMFDVPSSFVLDTGLLPLTALFELIRALTGWPPPGVK
jgi:uncharacterized protein YceK